MTKARCSHGAPWWRDDCPGCLSAAMGRSFAEGRKDVLLITDNHFPIWRNITSPEQALDIIHEVAWRIIREHRLYEEVRALLDRAIHQHERRLHHASRMLDI